MLRGLTRGLDLSMLDTGHGEHDGHAISFYPRTQALGVVLPSNSPGVHSLWVPAIAAEDAARAQAGQRRAVDAVPHRPGVHQGRRVRPRRSATTRRTTPARARSCGAPAAACSSATCRPSAAGKAIRASSCTARATARSSSATTWPASWERHVDLIAASIADNGGRSCVNASGVWVAASHAERGRRGAGREARAHRAARGGRRAGGAGAVRRSAGRRAHLAADRRRPRDAGRARGHRRVPSRPAAGDARRLHLPAADGRALRLARSPARQPRVPVPVRRGRQGQPPTRCARMPAAAGQDAGRDGADRAIARCSIGCSPRRSSTGSTSARSPTNQISWDQPHEGNLFEHLYARRSFQAAEPLPDAGRGRRSRENPVAHRRRRQHVLRQLPARQRARRRRCSRAATTSC